MYDSFGDGWDTTAVQIQDNKSTKVAYEGGLKDGSFGVENICLSKEPTCYTAVTGGGVWGVESSWEIKPMREGTPAREYNQKAWVDVVSRLHILNDRSCLLQLLEAELQMSVILVLLGMPVRRPVQEDPISTQRMIQITRASKNFTSVLKTNVSFSLLVVRAILCAKSASKKMHQSTVLV
jgi:hypothetical protein